MTDKQQPPERVWLEFFDDNVRGVSVYVPEWHDKTPITYRLERIKQNGFPYALVHPASEQCDLGTCSRPSDCRYYCIERHARVCVRPRNQRQPNTGTCEHGISWSMECLSCGHSDFVAARVQQADEARVEEIRERWSNVPTMSVAIWEGGDSLYEEQEPHRTIGYLHKQVDRDHAIALSKSKSDVDYLLSLLPQLSSGETWRDECEYGTERGIACTFCNDEDGKQRDIWGALNQRRAELIDVVRSRLLTGEETADLIALQRVAGLVRELVANHPFEVNDNSPAVTVRPTAPVPVVQAAREIAKWMNMMVRLPQGVVKQNATSIEGILRKCFPPIEATQPAGVEGGAAWLLPQIKRRLQTVLDCENGMCTHCCEVLAGDLAPMIDRAIELCATPAPAESEEAEPLNGSEDSWMTL